MTIRSGGRPRDPRDRRPPGAPVRAGRLCDRVRAGGRTSRRVAATTGRRDGAAARWRRPRRRRQVPASSPSSSPRLVLLVGADRAAAARQLGDPVAGPPTTRPRSTSRSSPTSCARTSATALTDPGLERPGQVAVRRRGGDTASTIAARLEEEGLIRDPRAFVFIAHERDLTGDLQTGEFMLRKNLTPDEMVTALLAPPEMPYVDIDAADRPAARADHGQAPDARRPGDGPARVLRAGQGAAGRRSSPTTRGWRRSWRTPPRAPRSKGSCGRRPTACCRTRRPRSSSG